MRLHELLHDVLEKETSGNLNIDIAGLAYDSREVKPGFLFAAIQGTNQDGHRYLRSAVERGASAALVQSFHNDVQIPQIKVSNTRAALAQTADAFYHHPTKNLKLIGVTGTNGKTTTTYLCESILSRAGYKTGIIGTIQYKVGEKFYDCKNTTPESLDLLKYFHEMVTDGIKACAMEVSSHALEQGRIHNLLFDVVVFTNLTQDHLDYHKTMEAYFESKAGLFTKIPVNKNPKAVINLDDPYGKRLASLTRLPLISFGLENGDVQAGKISLDWSGLSFQAKTPQGEFPVNLRLTGKFNVYNALAAIGAGLAMDIPPSTIRDGLEQASQVRGRFEQVHAGQSFAVLVDYAHSPDGLLNLLQSARRLTKGNLIVVFGCGGDRDRGKRPLMGKVVEDFADTMVITSDNPRSEEPMSIIKEIETGVNKPHEVEPDRKKAIHLALSLAKKDDCVVIAGKGHETYQIFKDKTIHFDDREIVLDYCGTPQPS